MRDTAIIAATTMEEDAQIVVLRPDTITTHAKGATGADHLPNHKAAIPQAGGYRLEVEVGMSEIRYGQYLNRWIRTVCRTQ